MKNNEPHRQGDILFVPIEKLPKEASKIKEAKEYTVALGEATGHHHTLYPAGADSLCSVFQFEEKKYLQIQGEMNFRHQEHDEHRILPGLYEIITEREEDPFSEEIKKVID